MQGDMYTIGGLGICLTVPTSNLLKLQTNPGFYMKTGKFIYWIIKNLNIMIKVVNPFWKYEDLCDFALFYEFSSDLCSSISFKVFSSLVLHSVLPFALRPITIAAAYDGLVNT